VAVNCIGAVAAPAACSVIPAAQNALTTHPQRMVLPSELICATVRHCTANFRTGGRSVH
jgi:hypothetical protein